MELNMEIPAGNRHLASQVFDYFCTSQNLNEILSVHTKLCNLLKLKPNRLKDFYPKLKSLLKSWKADELFRKFDKRLSHKEYKKGTACSNSRVLIIGAGLAGLKMAIECQLLGAKVVVIEKRDDFSRNNVIHLWPFVIQDLNSLGAKTFYGKFCVGSINHISIRRLQFILLKMALLLGIEIHTGVAFNDLVQPMKNKNNDVTSWRASLHPAKHSVSEYEFDVLIGADGRRNSLQGFRKNVLRTNFCIGITANFVNRNSEEEVAVKEIGGLSYVFAQEFFKNIERDTGVELENITYYKDDTHYFVMTAKKRSLLRKGVLIKDHANLSTLLSKENICRKALMDYAREAALTATKGGIPNMTFASNNIGEPDIAIFDFSTCCSSENASLVYNVLGKKLLCQLIGDSLIEPFWPTGSGCARCFLSAMDAAWAVRSWSQRPHKDPLQIIAERESIYRLLPQTTADNIHPNIGAYTIDPTTRYPNLNTQTVSPIAVEKLYIKDQSGLSETSNVESPEHLENISLDNPTLIAALNWIGHTDVRAAVSAVSRFDIVAKYRPDLLPDNFEEIVFPDTFMNEVLEREFSIPPLQTNSSRSACNLHLLALYNVFKGEVPYVASGSSLPHINFSTFKTGIFAPRPVQPFVPVAVRSSESKRLQRVQNNMFLQRKNNIQGTKRRSPPDQQVPNIQKPVNSRRTVGNLVQLFHDNNAAGANQETPRKRTIVDRPKAKRSYLSNQEHKLEPTIVEMVSISDDDIDEDEPMTNSSSEPDSSNSIQSDSQKGPNSGIEMDSDEEDSESRDDEDDKSSATEVSTDSEFACEESGVNLPPPEILVTEAPPHISPTQDYPLSRTKSAGGLATKRALELKRKYLLGESSPPTVRKSESTSQLDTKLEAFRLNITEFQKLLHPATPTPQTGKPISSNKFSFVEKTPKPDMPDIIKNICNPVDLLTKADSILDGEKLFRDERDPELETDSLSDESSASDTAANQSVPRLEVHNEGGELIQLDSLILVNEDESLFPRTTTELGPSSIAVESDSSESCKDGTTLALTETELSDWAREIVVIDEYLDENGLRKRNKNPRSLSGPKLIHDCKNIESISSHVCGRVGPDSDLVVYSNATDYFKFADEGDQDPTIQSTSTPCNEGYMELVDDDFDPYSASRDRSINFIERVCSDTTIQPTTDDIVKLAPNFSESLEFIDSQESKSGIVPYKKLGPKDSFSSAKTHSELNETSSSTRSCDTNTMDNPITIDGVNDFKVQSESPNFTDMSSPLLSTSVICSSRNDNSSDDVSPSKLCDSQCRSLSKTSLTNISASRGENLKNLRNYSPVIFRSGVSNDWSIPPYNDKISRDAACPYKLQSQMTKVEELKREREEQTEVVRRLVLQRLGGAKPCRKTTTRSKNRVLPSSMIPPPVPPPPVLLAPILPNDFSEVPPRPASQPRLSLSMQSSFSDPELNRGQRSSRGFLKSISNYFNKHLGPKYKAGERQRTTPANHHHRATTRILGEAGHSATAEPSGRRLQRITSTARPINRRGKAAVPAVAEAIAADMLQTSATQEAHKSLVAAASMLKSTWGSMED